jgi:hypothetical protein
LHFAWRSLGRGQPAAADEDRAIVRCLR